MKPDRVIESIWKIWVEKGVVDPELQKEFEAEMNWIYGAGFDEGTKHSSHPKPVAKLDDFGNILDTYDSAQEAANKNGITKSMVSKACLGRNATAGERNTGKGYHYKYITDGQRKEIESKSDNSERS